MFTYVCQHLENNTSPEQCGRVEVQSEWCLVGDGLEIGDAVCVTTPFITDDEKMFVKVNPEVRGEVKAVDEDHDVQICFPSLDGLRCTTRLVKVDKFKHLLVRCELRLV